MTDEHTITLLDSYTAAELRTMDPGEEMEHLLAEGKAFETNDEPVNISSITANFILEHVDNFEVRVDRAEPALVQIELNGERVEVAARCKGGGPRLRAAIAIFRAYIRLLKAGAERGRSADLRGMAEREAQLGVEGEIDE